jgi:hypothetical protein
MAGNQIAKRPGQAPAITPMWTPAAASPRLVLLHQGDDNQDGDRHGRHGHDHDCGAGQRRQRQPGYAEVAPLLLA